MSTEPTPRNPVLPASTPGVARSQANENQLSLASPALYLAIRARTVYVALDEETGRPVRAWREDQEGFAEIDVNRGRLRQLVATADRVRQTTVLHTPGWLTA